MSLTVQRPRDRFPPGWVVASLIVLMPTIVYLGIASWGLTLARANPSQPATSVERAHVVTAQEVARALGKPVDVDPGREWVQTVREGDGTLRVVYRYPDQPLPADMFEVESVATRAPDAVIAQRILSAAVWQQGTAFEEKPALFSWGDETKVGDLKRGPARAGGIVAVRSGRWVLVVKMLGATFDDPEQVRAVIGAKLDTLKDLGER